ncbi:hypothetical protein MMC24_001890 [Lignoscripta atroalba]|nr:hypothetical protein [Lignoscripta atroalba]
MVEPKLDWPRDGTPADPSSDLDSHDYASEKGPPENKLNMDDMDCSCSSLGDERILFPSLQANPQPEVVGASITESETSEPSPVQANQNFGDDVESQMPRNCTGGDPCTPSQEPTHTTFVSQRGQEYENDTGSPQSPADETLQPAFADRSSCADPGCQSWLVAHVDRMKAVVGILKKEREGVDPVDEGEDERRTNLIIEDLPVAYDHWLYWGSYYESCYVQDKIISGPTEAFRDETGGLGDQYLEWVADEMMDALPSLYRPKFRELLGRLGFDEKCSVSGSWA